MNRRMFLALAIGLGLAACQGGSVAYAQAEQPPVAGGQNAVEAGSGTGAAASASSQNAAPGPLLEERKALLDHIQQAGAHGIGIANYMSAYKALDDQVASGSATEPQVRSRVDSITKALREQLVRAQVLKTQRPLPPTAAQQADAGGAGAGGATSTGAGGGSGDAIKDAIAKSGKNPDEIINKLKEKFGAGGMEIPDGLKDKLLNSDKGKELLKKFGGM